MTIYPSMGVGQRNNMTYDVRIFLRVIFGKKIRMASSRTYNGRAAEEQQKKSHILYRYLINSNVFYSGSPRDSQRI